MVAVKLFIFNVKYSPNLGDGLLSECLELELRRAIGRPEVVSLDLAGRDQYGPGSWRREFALTLLERLPARLRRAESPAVFLLHGFRLNFSGPTWNFPCFWLPVPCW